MSDSVDVFMSFYVGDYLKKTTMLTCEENGAYLLLIFSLWQSGGYLPEDHKKLSMICRISSTKFKNIWEAISNYFEIKNNQISNRRVLEELDKARLRRVKARENGSKGGRPKTETQPKPSGLPSRLATTKAKPNPDESSSPSHSNTGNTNTGNTKKNTNTPPTPKGETDLKTAIAYAVEKRLDEVDVELWHKSRTLTDWTKANGSKVKDWRLDLKGCHIHGTFSKNKKPGPARMMTNDEAALMIGDELWRKNNGH